MTIPASRGITLDTRHDPHVEQWTPRQLGDAMYFLSATTDAESLMCEPMTLDSLEHEFHGAGISNCMVLDAVTSTYAKLPRTIAAMGKVLSRKLEGDLEVSGTEMGKVKKSGMFASVAAMVNISDGQSVSIIFHAPDDDPKNIDAGDRLIAFQFMLNRSNITSHVAPTRGGTGFAVDQTLDQVVSRIAQLVSANSSKFLNKQKVISDQKKELETKVEELAQMREAIDAATQSMADASNVLESSPDEEKGLNLRLGKLVEGNEALEKEIAGWRGKVEKSPQGGAEEPKPDSPSNSKMIEFNITKKNRKYFAATKDGYKCKILIDDNSKDLELGESLLSVEDISVRSKYGTDLIYKLAGSAKDQAEAGVVTLITPYNEICIEKCRALGGKWDASAGAWVFSSLIEDEVEALDEKYNSKRTAIQLTAKSDIFAGKGPATVAGFPIARAWGRDSGAKIEDGVSFLEGGADSGGSMKNWGTKISEGSVIRMMIPELCIVDIDSGDFSFSKIGESSESPMPDDGSDENIEIDLTESSFDPEKERIDALKQKYGDSDEWTESGGISAKLIKYYPIPAHIKDPDARNFRLVKKSRKSDEYLYLEKVDSDDMSWKLVDATDKASELDEIVEKHYLENHPETDGQQVAADTTESRIEANSSSLASQLQKKHSHSDWLLSNAETPEAWQLELVDEVRAAKTSGSQYLSDWTDSVASSLGIEVTDNLKSFVYSAERWDTHLSAKARSTDVAKTFSLGDKFSNIKLNTTGNKRELFSSLIVKSVDYESGKVTLKATGAGRRANGEVTMAAGDLRAAIDRAEKESIGKNTKNNLDERIEALRAMPIEEYEKAIDVLIEELDAAGTLSEHEAALEELDKSRTKEFVAHVNSKRGA